MFSDRRDEINRFVLGVSDDFKEECNLTMLPDNMNIYRLIVHAEYVEQARCKRKSSDAKRARSFHNGSSK